MSTEPAPPIPPVTGESPATERPTSPPPVGSGTDYQRGYQDGHDQGWIDGYNKAVMNAQALRASRAQDEPDPPSSAGSAPSSEVEP